VHLWRTSVGALLQVLDGHEGLVRDVVFLPEGELLASTSASEVLLWQLDDGVLLHSLIGHNDDVSSIGFSPEGTLLISGSWDGTVRLWGVR
jgi:WD40 repeat protein